MGIVVLCAKLLLGASRLFMHKHNVERVNCSFHTWAAGPGARCRDSCNHWSFHLLNKRRADKRGGTEVIHANNTATTGYLTFV